MEVNAETLRQIRDNKGLSQKEFAKFLGISERSYQNYEGGGVIPEGKKMLFASKLGAKNADIKQNPPLSMEDLLANKIMDKLLPIINKVLDSHQKIIKELLQQGLEIDELLDDVQELKENTQIIIKEVRDHH